MKICIPTRTNEGLEAKCGGDIRTARFFTVVDLDEDKLTVVPNNEHTENQGVCHALEQVGMDNIDAIVCRRIGRGAYYSLSDAGVDVYLAKGDTVGELVTDAREGRLKPASTDEIGHGCGHRHAEQRHRGSGSRHRHGRGGRKH